jgi:hypothetical protein
VAAVEVALVDEVEVVMTGQILLMALMYQTRLKTLWMKNGGNLRIMVDGCMWLTAGRYTSAEWYLFWWLQRFGSHNF